MLKKVPEDFSGFFDEIDPKDPYKQALSGLYEEPFEFDGRPRNVAFYIPEHTGQSCRNVSIVLPDDVEPEEFLEKSGWKETADREKFMLFLMQADGKWNIYNESRDSDAMLEFYNQAKARKYYNSCQTQRYLVGYDEGAVIALQMAMKNPNQFAATVIVNGVVGQRFMDEIGKHRSNVRYITLGELPMPLYFVAEELEEEQDAVIGYYIKANRCDPQPYYRRGRLIYKPDPVKYLSALQEQPVAELVVEERAMDWQQEGFADEAWSFLSKTIRNTGVKNTLLHPYRTPAEWGCKRHYLTCDDIIRHWEEYVPSINKRQPNRPLPLIVDLHGGSNICDWEINASEWVNVAEARNACVVFPTGTMRIFEANVPHPAWNASENPKMFDDMKFLRNMVREICSRLPIDETRIYVTGHSMGSAMTQHCLLAMPDIFAAGASNSGVVCGNHHGTLDMPSFQLNYDVPVWIQMGEHDMGGGTFEENANAVNTVNYWLERNGCGGIDEPEEYVSGPYRTKIYRNQDGVPMVTYVVTDEKPHCDTPQDPWLYYDLFFAHFSRDEKGRTCYNGKPLEHGIR